MTADDEATGPEPPTESWIDLPAYIERPLEVYVNGIVQQTGVDFRIVERSLVIYEKDGRRLVATGLRAR